MGSSNRRGLWRPGLVVGCVALAASLACSNRVQRFDMLFDPCVPLVLEAHGVSDEELAIVEAAIDLWQDVFAIETTVEDVAGARRMRVLFRDDVWYYGRFDDTRARLEVATWIEDPDTMAIVLAHELGHAFNLYHVDESERLSVMNPGNVDVPPTPADGEELAGLWGECDTRR